MRFKRDCYCGDLSSKDIGREVSIAGWVQRRRDHGGLVFVDLRDRSGIVQVVFSPERNADAHRLAHRLRNEFVIAVRGEVMRRPEGTENLSLPTGDIEVHANYLEIINPSKPLPFPIEDDIEVSEDVRMRYRYLDLRRPSMQRNLMMRHRVCMEVRKFLSSEGFIEIETPILWKDTPEGARSYIVPSRVNPGMFFALPQSPQLCKQLLMVAGFDKYFQIARCFRDEDLRADRQPEFTQIDIEMSFVDEDDVMSLTERLMRHIFKSCMEVEIEIPFPRIPYKEAMERFGTDKPDIRFGMELVDVSDIVSLSNFRIFREVLERGGVVKGINAKGCGRISRKELDELAGFVTQMGGKGLAWMKVTGEGVDSPIAKFFHEGLIFKLLDRMGGDPGDLLLFLGDSKDIVLDVLGRLRVHMAEKAGLMDKVERFGFVWVNQFPMFEYNEEEGRLEAVHHPFTSPLDEDIPLLSTDPLSVRAKAYDIILNGIEVGGGSIRIHDRDLQMKIFSIIGLGEEEARKKFSFLLEAFEFGAPPHGGIAPGLDRIVRIMVGAETIRDVIAFPKTQKAMDLMAGAPSRVSEKQLKELNIALRDIDFYEEGGDL
jgi:aspartyl-tRNA synthetase